MNDIRKACVRAVFDEFDDHGDAIMPACGDVWDEIEARRPLGHIGGRWRDEKRNVRPSDTD